jgi:hypothetical protein
VALPAFGRSPEPRLAAAAVALFLGRRPSPGEGEALGRRALSLHDAVTEVLRSAEFVGRVLDPLARGEALPHGARPGPLFAEAAALLRPFFPAAGAEALCRAVAGEARGTLTALLAERGLREAVFPAVGADPALRHARRLLDGLGRDGPGGPRILSADVLPDGRVETVVAGTPPGGPLSARCEIDDGTGTVVETGLTPAAEGEDRFRVRFRLPAALCDGRTRYAVLRLAAPGWPAPPALPLALSAGDANLAREHDRLLKLLRRALRQASEGPRDAAAALLDEMAASAFAPEDTGLVRALLLLRDGRRGEAGLALAAVDRAEVREPAVFRLGAGLALALGRPAEALAWYGSAARRRLPPTACDLLLAAFAESVLLAPQAPPAGRAGVLPGDAAAAFPAISRLLRRALGGESVEDHALIEAGAAQPRDVAALAVPALVGVLADEAVVERFLAMLARGGVLTPGEAAAALASNGLLDLAVPALARLAPEHFATAGLLVRLGKARQRAGDDDETSAAALAFAERALALAPGDEDALALAASLNRRLRRPEAALTPLPRAARAAAGRPRGPRAPGGVGARRARPRADQGPRRPGEVAGGAAGGAAAGAPGGAGRAGRAVRVRARPDPDRGPRRGPLHPRGSPGGGPGPPPRRARPPAGGPARGRPRGRGGRGNPPADARALRRRRRRPRQGAAPGGALRRGRGAPGPARRPGEPADRARAGAQPLLPRPFAEAAARGEACVDRHPDDLELRLLTAAARLELGQWREAERHVCYVAASGGAERLPVETPLYLFATARKAGLAGPAFARLDPLFLAMGCQTVRPGAPAGRTVFDRLAGGGRHPAAGSGDGFPPVLDGPLVSVVMTAHNAAAYVETAVRSILDQSYRNLELVVVDDASTDATPDILEGLERRDPRLRTILKTGNDGTYVAKNLGLLQARGCYVALQDADDWSHPDRLAKSVAVLAARPEVVGLTTDWLRMTSDGEAVVKAGGQNAHVCCISLVFRREPVLRRVGFFDSVRIEGDMEYIRRMGLAFGPDAVLRLRWPLLFGRSRSDSLTLARSSASPAPATPSRDASTRRPTRLGTRRSRRARPLRFCLSRCRAPLHGTRRHAAAAARGGGAGS